MVAHLLWICGCVGAEGLGPILAPVPVGGLGRLDVPLGEDGLDEGGVLHLRHEEVEVVMHARELWPCFAGAEMVSRDRPD